MADKTGAARLRQAIKNQRDLGNGDFRLTYHDAEEIAGEIEEESDWAICVPAPVDADGKVVPLMTEVMYNDDGRKLKVSMFRFSIDPRATRWVAMCSNGNGGNGYADVSSIHLHLPDSWERLEEDVERYEDKESACSYYGEKRLACDHCPSPARSGRMCLSTVPSDVLRRAKTLAERDAKGVADA